MAPLSIASNPESVKAQSNLRKTTAALSDSYEKLSSGLRINSGKDDPSGLALADTLRADALVASVAVRNANDGLSLTAIADAALGEISTILTRMGELATQSSNGTYSTSQRSALSSEFVALGSEIDRIAKTTTFNGFALLSNSQNITLQVGFNGNSNSQILMTRVLGTLGALGLSSAAAGDRLTYSIIDTTSTGSQAAALVALSAVTAASNSLTITRGTLSGAQSRLEVAVDYLSVARENFIAAESRIRDIDVAQEVAKLVRLQVLQQADVAVLAQANQRPATALLLLQ